MVPDVENEGNPLSMSTHTESTSTCSERVSEASSDVGCRPEKVVPSLFTASPVPVMLTVRSTAAPTSFWQGCPESLAVQKGQLSTWTLNLMVPALTPNDSVPVGEMVPASRKMKVVTIKFATLLIRGVLKLMALAETPDTEVWTALAKVKSVLANVWRLEQLGKCRLLRWSDPIHRALYANHLCFPEFGPVLAIVLPLASTSNIESMRIFTSFPAVVESVIFPECPRMSTVTSSKLSVVVVGRGVGTKVGDGIGT